MENTQRQHWLFYRDALRTMKHGRTHAGVDKCLELLLEPGLNVYLRAMLLMTVAEFGSIERFPHKLQLVDEALQLAARMKENYGPQQTTALIRIERLIWRASAAKLVIEEQLSEHQKTGLREAAGEGGAEEGKENDKGEDEDEARSSEESEEFVDAISSQEYKSDVSEFVASQRSTSSESDIGLPANVVGSGGDRRKGLPVRASKKFGLNTPVTSDQAEAEAELKDD